MRTEQRYIKDSIVISPSPNYIGGWKLPNLNMYYMTESKPNIWLRFFNKLLIGWIWKSNEEISIMRK